ncbi:MAG: M23 family metallopeptidase [Acidobacteria bacterium]|nr:M23 family metallopeptidase [Acidobacteriota bacterium]
MKVPRLLVLALVSSALMLAGAAGCAKETGPPRGLAAAADILLSPDTEEIADSVPQATTLAKLFRTYLPPDRAEAAVRLVSLQFNPRKLRANQRFTLTRTLDGWLRGFDYEIDLDRRLRVAPATPEAPRELVADIVEYKRQEATAAIAGRIDKQTPSLFEAMHAVGETDDLSIELAAIFSGEVDFNSGIQPGDQFRVAVHKVTRETGTASYGAVFAAEFVNEGRHLKAFRFTHPDGTVGYYDENGRSLKRFMLWSPLKFEPRVTSGFSYNRMHPVLNIARAHLGVDFAAPIGAPVVSVANGVVTQAGFSGEAGRLVAVRHSSGYETMYLHLSSIAVRAGQHVSQGDLVGRVGASGLATGPHLDYRIRKNGAYVNPLVERRRMPPGEPIAPALLVAFQAERDRQAALLPAEASSAVPGAATLHRGQDAGRAGARRSQEYVRHAARASVTVSATVRPPASAR